MVEKTQEVFAENGNIKLPEEEEALLPQSTISQNGHSVEDTALEEGKTEEKKENGDVNPEVTALLGSPVRRLSEIAAELYNSGETACGVGCIKGSFLQRFANKKAYVIAYGIIGCVLSSSYSYFNGTLTTLERRFNIPSTSSGIIMAGCDIGSAILCLFLNYVGGKGHRPRWISFGMFSVTIYCVMNFLLHVMYGPGQDSLDLTVEFGGQHDANTTELLLDAQNRKVLCQDKEIGCEDNSGSLVPQVFLFIAHLISGVGSATYYSLGVAYMDDNTKKSHSPALFSFSFFLRLLGPAAGYGLASACLRVFIAPNLTPTIKVGDPRWLGAWWLGWIAIGSLSVIGATTMALFPRSLPKAAARRVLDAERRKAGLALEEGKEEETEESAVSFQDLKITFTRLINNKILMCTNISSGLRVMGYMPYWVFMPKYIETIFKKDASFSNFITGSVGLIFCAIGLLASGVFISKKKPSARFLAAWNVLVGACSVLGLVGFALLGCPANDRQGIMLTSGLMDMNTPCNADCHCNYVKYTPVCSPDGRTFISPCHAGCTDYEILPSGDKVYKNCACVHHQPQPAALNVTNSTLGQPLEVSSEQEPWLVEGFCPIECSVNFNLFVLIVCVLEFIKSTGITSNFLVSIRCVEEKDKAVSMGLGIIFMSAFAFIPSPILFGKIIDKTCLVWGKTCAGTGNCWLYNGEMLRYLFNFAAAAFISVGLLFDSGVWYLVKDLNIFDEEDDQLELSTRTENPQEKKDLDDSIK